MRIQVYTLTGRDALGIIPMFLNEQEPGNAVTQLNAGYAHGGGWRDFTGFTVEGTKETGFTLRYPGDPAYIEQARIYFRDELISIFPCAWVMVQSPGHSPRICRMD